MWAAVAVLWPWGGGALYCGVSVAVLWRLCHGSAVVAVLWFQRGHGSVVVVWLQWCGGLGNCVAAVV